jgi:hypothetical protein
MVHGFNTDFTYRGETYHVQTEDLGTGNPVVVTLLYHKGAILASRRTSYHDLAGKPGFEKELMGIMKTQHKDVMRSLLAGAYDRNGAAPTVARGKGEDPAAAAAVTSSAPAPQPQREHATGATGAGDTSTATSSKVDEPRPASTSLDEATTRYRKESAGAAARH